MYLKSAPLFFLVFLVCAAVSAQDYSVRVAYNTNLRASHSLDARIVGLAPAGATLQVVAAFDRWLQINRSGNIAWMADWVPMTRVEGAQGLADIDNCCFIGRQCNTDQEWTAGYWAYQNNQCGAPVTPVSGNSTPISATDTGATDNCCFIGWQCHSDSDWVRGFHAYQSNSCDAVSFDPSGIRVEGTEGFKALVRRALGLLQRHSAYWYNYVLSGTNVVIEVNPPEGHYTQGVDVESAEFRFNLAKPFYPIPDDDYTMAEFLVHEACHVHRYRAGLEPGNYPGEKACVEAEVALWRDVPTPHSLFLDRNLRYLAVIHLRECQHWLPPVPGVPCRI